jgi:phosphopantothenoylcysteine decarboxylase/phosphopantothenate--cysteine ligase
VRHPNKLAKQDVPTSLELEVNADILTSLQNLQAANPGLVKVGFAAETHEVIGRAQQKLVAKGLDLIVANDVSDPTIGMGSPDNAVTIIGRDGSREEISRSPKEEVADRVLSAALRLRAEARTDRPDSRVS